MTGTSNYLNALPSVQREALQRLRKQIIAAAPGAEEHFGYGMPAFTYNGHPLLYIGAAKNHCALYGSVPVGFKEQRTSRPAKAPSSSRRTSHCLRRW